MREKEQSNLTAPPPCRYTLQKVNVLRGRTNYKSLFSHSLLLSSGSVFLRYRIKRLKSSEFKVAFIAPKKIGSAVKRNRIKRLMREAYRLNQQIINTPIETALLIHVALISRTTDADFQAIQKDIITLLHKLRTRVSEHTLLNT